MNDADAEVALADAIKHAAQLQELIGHRQRSLIDFDEAAGRAKFGLGSSAVVVDQAEDIRRALLQDLETHLVPIVVAAVGLAGRGNPEIPMRVAREAQDVAVGLSRAEASLARTAQFSPSSPNTGSVATMSAEEATDAINAVGASLDRLTRDLSEIASLPRPHRDARRSPATDEFKRNLRPSPRPDLGPALGR